MCFSHVLTVLSLFTYLCCFATEVTLDLANTVEPCLTDTPEKRPSMILLTLCLVMNTFTYVCVQSKTLKLNPEAPVFHKAGRFSRSQQYLVCTKFGWIQRPGLIIISIVGHRANLLNLIWQEKGPKIAASLCSPTQVHITMPTRSIPEAAEIRIPPYYRHTAVVPKVSTLEELNCIHNVGFLLTIYPTSRLMLR